MITAVLISRSKVRVTFLHVIIWSLSPFVTLLISLLAIYLGQLALFFGCLVAALILLVGAYFYGVERFRDQRKIVEIDTQNGVIVFRHFRFITAFLPDAPREAESVRFSEVIGTEIGIDNRGTRIRLRTSKGIVTVTDEMAQFDVILVAFNEIVEANQSRESDYAKLLEQEPKIKTPWYAWVVFFMAVGVVAIIGWHFLYREY